MLAWVILAGGDVYCRWYLPKEEGNGQRQQEAVEWSSLGSTRYFQTSLKEPSPGASADFHLQQNGIGLDTSEGWAAAGGLWPGHFLRFPAARAV